MKSTVTNGFFKHSHFGNEVEQSRSFKLLRSGWMNKGLSWLSSGILILTILSLITVQGFGQSGDIIQGNVTYDLDCNGTGGSNDYGHPLLNVELYIDANGNGVADPSELFRTTQTDMTGNYSFDIQSSTGNSFQRTISSVNDDVEEHTSSSGWIARNGSDLELVYDGTINQTVGLRFSNIQIPNGALITNAYIQFKADESSSVQTDVKIEGHNTGNSWDWTNEGMGDFWGVSLRERTLASVDWNNIPSWTSGDQGTDQQTPDLSTIVQELVDLGNYENGNAIAFILSTTVANSRRVAVPYDTDPVNAPTLTIEWDVPVPSGDYIVKVSDENFSGLSTTLSPTQSGGLSQGSNHNNVDFLMCGDSPLCYAMADNGNSSTQDGLVAFNRVTGTGHTVIYPVGAGDAETLTFTNDASNLVSVDNGYLTTYDPVTGSPTVVGPKIPDFDYIDNSESPAVVRSTMEQDADGIAIRPDGGYWTTVRIDYLSDSTTLAWDALIRLDGSGNIVNDVWGSGIDGLALYHTGVDTLTDVDDLALDPVTGKLYANVNYYENTDQLLMEIDTMTGLMTYIATFTYNGENLRDIEGFGFTNSGLLYITTGEDADNFHTNNSAYLVDLNTGVATQRVNLLNWGRDYEGCDCLSKGIVVEPPPPGNPFVCNDDVFIAQNQPSDFLTIDQSATPYTFSLISNLGVYINAIGFRMQDGYIYGMSVDEHLYRVDATGTAHDLGIPVLLSDGTTPLPNSPFSGIWFTGAIDEFGDYYFTVPNSSNLYKVDVTATPPTYEVISLSQNIRASDMAYNYRDGKWYAIGDGDLADGKGNLFTMTPGSGTWTVDKTAYNGPDFNWSQGACWFNSNGDFFAYDNNAGGGVGKVYIVDINASPPTVTYVSDGPTTGQNDGCSCPGRPVMYKDTDTRVVEAGNEVIYTFTISQATGTDLTGLTWTDSPSFNGSWVSGSVEYSTDGTTYSSTNPVGGTLSGEGTGTLSLSGFTMPATQNGETGYTFYIRATYLVDSSVPSDTWVCNQATLTGIPSGYGGDVLSDDPTTGIFGDCTSIYIAAASCPDPVTYFGGYATSQTNTGVQDYLLALGPPNGDGTLMAFGDVQTLIFDELIATGTTISIVLMRNTTEGVVTIEQSTDGVSFSNPEVYGDPANGSVTIPAGPVGTYETISYVVTQSIQYLRFTRDVGQIRLDAAYYYVDDCSDQNATISDFVWHDVDMDGIQDPGEPGISGATVELYAFDPINGNTPVATTATDGSGLYSFDNLDPGRYLVVFLDPGDPYTDRTKQNIGTDDSIDSDAHGTVVSTNAHYGMANSVLLQNGESNNTVDGGFVTATDPCSTGIYFDATQLGASTGDVSGTATNFMGTGIDVSYDARMLDGSFNDIGPYIADPAGTQPVYHTNFIETRHINAANYPNAGYIEYTLSFSSPIYINHYYMENAQHITLNGDDFLKYEALLARDANGNELTPRIWNDYGSVDWIVSTNPQGDTWIVSDTEVDDYLWSGVTVDYGQQEITELVFYVWGEKLSDSSFEHKLSSTLFADFTFCEVPSSPNIDTVVVHNMQCTVNGSIDVYFNGGTGPYTISYYTNTDPTVAVQTFTGVTSSPFTITNVDDQGLDYATYGIKIEDSNGGIDIFEWVNMDQSQCTELLYPCSSSSGGYVEHITAGGAAANPYTVLNITNSSDLIDLWLHLENWSSTSTTITTYDGLNATGNVIETVNHTYGMLQLMPAASVQVDWTGISTGNRQGVALFAIHESTTGTGWFADVTGGGYNFGDATSCIEEVLPIASSTVNKDVEINLSFWDIDPSTSNSIEIEITIGGVTQSGIIETTNAGDPAAHYSDLFTNVDAAETEAIVKVCSVNPTGESFALTGASVNTLGICTCVITITDSTIGACNDNGTSSDPSDDTFDVTVNATATNGGASNQFNVTDGTTTWGPFDYGTGGTVTGLPADASTITLTFTDVDDNSCVATVDVSQNSCSNDQFDLALRKTLASQSDDPLIAGTSTVTFDIWVFNQGDMAADSIEITDYIPAGLTLADANWTDNGNGTADKLLSVAGGELTNALAAGDSLSVQITFSVDVGVTGILTNYAEISYATDDSGNPVTDIDSSPNNLNDETAIINDEINDDGTIDEDDHDLACISVPVELCEGQSVELQAESGHTSYQWYKDGVEMNGEINPVLTVAWDASGNYIGEYSYVVDGGTLGSCSGQMCCPVILQEGNCSECPKPVCIPISISKTN